ncbi:MULTISPECIES: response regulator transcription factor [unclassified Oceanispirochaeta]|uniref:response regulator transcription factor n=1 Tax=unclassified Oceanispirochaeta TaxID=2635722 RepID=UPI000E09ABEA|nr:MULTISPECIES: response regulator transcription factor [unclassified Oceanispirochaeta]MBF9018363.1 response regulator transcription factor [Oceanispirochaeta sp. M2]NPD74833.1 response regulator transcription factor [Oceanispirochaeta sp. M1]RDG29326.1 DNA-binding response regulator [Oceanispirochaeta sp. M1]
MKGKILIVEDEKDIADVMILYLNKEGVQTSWAETGEKALEMLSNGAFDLVVLDINLPGIDGYQTLNELRKYSRAPVIIVSARQEDLDQIMGFGAGADDYVTKPFSPAVLVARIRAHLHRSNVEGEEIDLFRFGSWILDRSHQILSRGEEKQNLSPREMDILLFLSRNRDKAYSQNELYTQIWGNDFGDLSTVSVHIQRLRKKLEDDPSHPLFIKTRYGYGYYFTGGTE